GRGMVTRENGRRYVGIRMNVRNRDLGSFVGEAMGRVEGAVKLPVGYELTWGGEFENQQRAMARLTLVLPLALAITFLLLFSSFGSVWDALMILFNVPFALLGGVVGLALAHMTLSVSAAVGFIALLGQAVLNGVLVVAAIKARRERGEPLLDAVTGGAHDRLRAVLMTALLASLGLVPAAMSHAIGSETQRPIAVVVVWGTISAAALTLVVLPVTYYWATLLRERVARRMRRADPPPPPRPPPRPPPGSLKPRLAAVVLGGVSAATGFYAYQNLTVEAFPDPTDTQVQVITLFPGQPTEEVERRVSIPLERALNGTPNLHRLRSISL